jgi:tetratricopeptide (TPR) repeat protein
MSDSRTLDAHSAPPDSAHAAPHADRIDALLDQAELAMAQGQASQASASLEAVLQLDAEQFDAWHLLGALAIQAGQWPQAIERIQRAIAIAPDEAMAHNNLGVAWMQSGQPALAQASFERALALAPDYAEAHFGLGLIHNERGQWASAATHFARVLALQPGHAEAAFQQGRACLALQQYAQAVACYDQALAVQPQYVSALINRGHAQLALGDHEAAAAAAASCEQALALAPERTAAMVCLGDACLALGRFEQAVASYERALASPGGTADQAGVLANLGSALLQLRRLPEAMARLQQALALRPQNADVLANLGGALRDSGRPDEALAACARALALEPTHLGALMNSANVLFDTGRWADAGLAFARVTARSPDNAEAQWALGWCQLTLGDWARGFQGFEWRFKKPRFPSPPRAFTQPQWCGDTDLRGRTILLHAEQGLGDTIQFCRYVPMVAARGARVILEVQPALKGLMKSLAGAAMVIGQGELPMLPAFELHCPLMSLPLAFQTTLDTLVTPPSYLSADPPRVAALGQRLGPKDRPRVGLVWSGNPNHPNDANRSLPLSTVLEAMPPWAELFVLQKDIRAADTATLQARDDIAYLPDVFDTFEGTAALIAHMDVVVCVDTSVAHLAAALGKPTWILVSQLQDWRWLLGRDDSPWYASVRLFRQAGLTPAGWAPALHALRQALEADFAPGQAPRLIH